MNRKKLMMILLGLAVVLFIVIVVLLIIQIIKNPAPNDPRAGEESANNAVMSAALSPEDVVSQYFAYWNEKNATGMDTCLILEDRGQQPHDFQYEASIELLSLTEEPKEIVIKDFNDAWYQDPYDIAHVLANFTITYNEQGQEFYHTESVLHEGYHFWLVKETENGGWQIVLQGY